MATLSIQKELQVANLFLKRLGKERGLRPRAATGGVEQGTLQIGQTVSAVGLYGNHGHSESALQMSQLELHPSTGGNVEHIHSYDRGQAQFQNLAHQIKVPLEVRSIDDANDDVDGPDVRLPLEEDLDRDHFVARSGRKAIKTRQINQLEPLPLEFHPAGLFFDRHARIVTHVLMDTDEGPEKRRFTGIGITDQGNSKGCPLVGTRHFSNIAKRDRNDGNTQPVIRTKTNLVTGHADDTGVTRPKHLNAGPSPQAKFFKTVDMVSGAMNAVDPLFLAGPQFIQRDRAVLHLLKYRSFAPKNQVKKDSKPVGDSLVGVLGGIRSEICSKFLQS